MKYSRNPSTGEVEAYSDEGVFIGNIYSMGDSLNSSASDGGEGSGNRNHAGRPGLVGGSAPSGGSASSGVSKSHITKSGEDLAKRTLEKFECLSDNKYSLHNKSSYISDLYGYGMYPYPKEGKEKETYRKLIEHYCDVLKYNGDPSHIKNGKKVMAQKEMYAIQERKSPLTREERLEKLKEFGIPDSEAEETLKQLELYTSQDWKNADSSVLEKYIETRNNVYCSNISRGVHLDKKSLDDLMKQVESGVVSFGQISSWSSSPLMAEQYAVTDKENNQISDDETPVIFSIQSGHSRSGVSIAEFSSYREGEVVFSGKSSFSVLAVGHNKVKRKDGEIVDSIKITLMERGEEYD